MTRQCPHKTSHSPLRGRPFRRGAVPTARRGCRIALTGLLLAVWASHNLLMAQPPRRLPMDMTPTTSASLYRPQQWQAAQRPAGFVRPASFTQLKETPVAAPEAMAEPFIAASTDTDWDSGGTETAAPVVGEGFFVQLGTWTVIVLCLCVLTILGIRRWQRSRGMLPDGVQSGRVLDTLTLGPGRSISLIQIQGLRALVGCDASGIRTIAMAAPAFDEAFRSAMDDTSMAETSSFSGTDQTLTGG